MQLIILFVLMTSTFACIDDSLASKTDVSTDTDVGESSARIGSLVSTDGGDRYIYDKSIYSFDEAYVFQMSLLDESKRMSFSIKGGEAIKSNIVYVADGDSNINSGLSNHFYVVISEFDRSWFSSVGEATLSKTSKGLIAGSFKAKMVEVNGKSEFDISGEFYSDDVLFTCKDLGVTYRFNEGSDLCNRFYGSVLN